jgi:ribosomal protein L2
MQPFVCVQRNPQSALIAATIGEVGNGEHNLRSFGKAGAKRWLGIRPPFAVW